MTSVMVTVAVLVALGAMGAMITVVVSGLRHDPVPGGKQFPCFWAASPVAVTFMSG